METLNEAAIDEVRWPRMFAKLRRAGWYASCGCAGCGDCQRAAKRFVVGIARTGRDSRRPMPISFAADCRVRSRLMKAGREVGVVLDSADPPTIVDVAPSIAPVEGEAGPTGRKPLVAKRSDLLGLKWAEAIRYRRIWPADTSRLISTPRRVPDHPAGLVWSGPATFADHSKVPSRVGLYLIVWPNGAYLGSGAESGKGIRSRVVFHIREFRSWHYLPPNDPEILKQLPQYRVYWLDMSKTGWGKSQIEDLERKYMNTIGDRDISEKWAVWNSPHWAARIGAFAKLGFRNRKELETADVAVE